MLKQELTVKDVLLTIKDWFKYILKKWWITLIVILTFGFIGFLISYFDEVKYNSQMSFVLGDETASEVSGLVPGFLRNGAASQTGLFSNSDNIIWLYGSSKILKETLLTKVTIDNNQDLLVNYFLQEAELRNEYKEKKSKKLDVTFQLDIDSVSDLQNAVIHDCIKYINRDYLIVTTVPKTVNVINVSFIAKNEKFAKSFVESLVKSANNLYIISKTKNVLQEVKSLEYRVDSLRSRMGSEMKTYAQAVENIPYPNPNLATINVAPQEIKVESDIGTALYVSAVERLEVARIALAKETPLIQIIDTPQLPLPTVSISMKKSIPIGIIIGLFISILGLTIYRFIVINLHS